MPLRRGGICSDPAHGGSGNVTGASRAVANENEGADHHVSRQVARDGHDFGGRGGVSCTRYLAEGIDGGRRRCSVRGKTRRTRSGGGGLGASDRPGSDTG